MSTLKSSIKYLHSDFDILDSLAPLRPHILLAYTPPPTTNVYIVFFKEDNTEKYFAKEPQTVQNKDTTVPNYWKMSNHNNKESPGIEFAFFRCTMGMGMDDIGYMNSSFYFISIL